MKKLILFLMTILINISCSSNISAKKLKIRDFKFRTYRFCSEREKPDYAGKLCYRVSTRTILKRCIEKKLIVEDLSDPKTHRKFQFGNFRVRKASDLAGR